MTETELVTYHPQNAQQPAGQPQFATYDMLRQFGQPTFQQPAQQQPQKMVHLQTPTADPMAQPNPVNPLPINLGQGLLRQAWVLKKTDTRAAAMPGTPETAATNAIDQHGGLDPRGLFAR